MSYSTRATDVQQLKFDFGLGKEIVGEFDGGKISSDSGVVLLRQLDEKLKLSEQVAICLGDRRDLRYIKHAHESLIRQRLYMIGAGYEDCNDANLLRKDAAFKVAVGRCPDTDPDAASQPTFSRLENSVTEKELEFMQRLLVHLFIRQFRKPPQRLTLDIDTTCDNVYGYQQLSFYNGFYQTDCFTPLFVFSGSFPLAAVLRPGNASPAQGAIETLERIIKALRLAWPNVIIDIRADAGFAVPGLYHLCEQFSKVFYFVGLPANNRLNSETESLKDRCKTEYIIIYGTVEEATKEGKNSRWLHREKQIRSQSKEQGRMQERFEHQKLVRRFIEFDYQADSWSKKRRVIARCDYSQAGAHLRYVVTNHTGGRPWWLYEDKYCKRGQCENYIKDLKIVKCDRLSCQEFLANQFRLLLHAFAYILLDELRKLAKTSKNDISIHAVRLRFIKVAAQVKETTRRVWFHWSSAFPWQESFCMVAAHLNL